MSKRFVDSARSSRHEGQQGKSRPPRAKIAKYGRNADSRRAKRKHTVASGAGTATACVSNCVLGMNIQTCDREDGQTQHGTQLQ